MIYEKFLKFSYVFREFNCFENSKFSRHVRMSGQKSKVIVMAEKKTSPSEETVRHEVGPLLDY